MCDSRLAYSPSEQGIEKLKESSIIPIDKRTNINFKVKYTQFGYLVKLGCGREIMFKDKDVLVKAMSAYLENPESLEKEFDINLQ